MEYLGEWKGQKRHGFGKQTFGENGEYIGFWQNDKAQGFGKMTFSENEGSYEG